VSIPCQNKSHTRQQCKFFPPFSHVFYSESSKQIDYLERNFLKPTKDDAEKLDKLSLPLKDRETLQRIYGIIETNALYLTTNNEVAGNVSEAEHNIRLK
jgi:hypothetical protein